MFDIQALCRALGQPAAVQSGTVQGAGQRGPAPSDPRGFARAVCHLPLAVGRVLPGGSRHRAAASSRLAMTSDGQSHGLLRRVAVAALAGGAMLAMALGIGAKVGMTWESLPLIATGLVWEAQPAAAASIALGFPPWAGALVSCLANAAPIPLLLAALPTILTRWQWARIRVEHARGRVRRFLPWGLWALALAAPWLGTYLTLSLGITMGLSRRRAASTVIAAMAVSVAIICYGGTSVVALFRS
jgi:hypothetical protein